MNFGEIDMAKLERLARLSGISKNDLNKALAERRLVGIKFSASFYLA